MNNAIYVKPLATGVTAVVLDMYALQQPDMKKSAYFGAAVALGTGVATAAMPMVPKVLRSMGDAIDGKTLSARVLEVGLGTGSAWALNKYVIKNEIPREQMIARLGVIAASGFIGEYVTDYWTGKPFSYFA